MVSALLLTACSGSREQLAADSAAEQSASAAEEDQVFEATDASAGPAAAKQRTDTFVSTINTPGGVFLPYFYDNGWDGNAIDPIFSPLVIIDDSGQPVPELAESWDISDDNLTYTFHLRDNLKFSDGSPLTAEDVKFTLELLNDPAYSGTADFTDIVIAGTDEFKNGDATGLSGIKVLDDQTVEITTEKVNPRALGVLGGMVLSKAYYGAGYKKGNLDYLRDLYAKPLGAGPFKFDKYVTGQEIRYDANENYWDGRPKLNHVIYKIVGKDSALAAFENGEIDFAGLGTKPETLDEVKDLPWAGVKVKQISDLGEVWLNNRVDTLKDTEFRQALYYGLDREQIVQAKYNGLGQVANIYAPPVLWSFDESKATTYDFNPDKARELLDNLGWTVGADGIRERDGKRLSLSYITTAEDDPLIPVAQQNYRDIGIDFVPEILDSNTATTRLTEGDYEMIAFRTNGAIDPDDLVEEFGTDNPDINVTGYNNPKVTELVQKGVSTTAQNERQQIYTELYGELSQDPPTLLIDNRRGSYAWNARVDGANEYTTGSSMSPRYLAKLSIPEQQ